jgi:carbon storage regulator
MLVLRRRVGESVILDRCIEVQIVEISGARVKLGFTAPRAIEVMRKEIQLTRDENRRAAAFESVAELKMLAESLGASRHQPKTGDGPAATN